MDYRETTVSVYGVTRTVRTERTGTARQMESAHTRAVRATLEELHAAGKGKALAAAKKTARAAAAKARNHHSGPLANAAREAHDRVAAIEKRKFEAPSFPNFKVMAGPRPPVKYDLDPTDARFADCHKVVDPNAPVEAPTAEAPRPLMGPKAFLDSLLASVQPPAPAVQEPADEEPMDLEKFLNDFFTPTTS